MNQPGIGFIGFGEAAFHITSGLVSEGVTDIFAFDVMSTDPVVGPIIKERADLANVTLTSSLKQLIESSQVVFCATSAKYALAIAQESAAFLQKEQIYVDMNSASPKVKQEIAKFMDDAGAGFVDAAVMEAVPPHRHKVPISVSGTGARKFTDLMGTYGMNITYINDEAGSASAMKMVRSIFMKGFTALLLETLTAAYKSGIEQEILSSIRGTLSNHSTEELANLLLTRTAIHAERRVAEMGEVISTLKDLDLDYSVSLATKGKLQQLVDLDLKSYFDMKAPEHFTQVLEALINKSVHQ
ncbi:DUF1932 domain-containing protein [Paenibacillus sp. LMG 31456]|uniref:DUF1932 domain-containing protein n=1 Tax=Paenibacillus foliorum TaxID=2654974 RepID=A0A972GQF7_9BACL|nr:DUF1932 domain-containing protein [Paenibacillus foliorum]NOU94498.1 DUF1932 domain-containing protein [Paenibacillus foliorum]